MDSDRRLEAVRRLAHLVVEQALPRQLSTFDLDFAHFTLSAGAPYLSERASLAGPRDLDTTLVAGMFFQVMAEAESLPASLSERITFVRKEAKNFLANRLAGQITLSQFYRLLTLIEQEVQHYFEYLQADWLGPSRERRAAALPRTAPGSVNEEELRQALERLELPKKGRRITTDGLFAFLANTEGWFRLLDMEAHFKVNKKTAWTCLNLLLKAGLLEHNGEKANRVRYLLASSLRANYPDATPPE